MKTKENPIFYVQYVCVRLNSLFEKSKINIDKEIENINLDNLNNNIELNLIKNFGMAKNCKFMPFEFRSSLYSFLSI